MLVDDTVFVLSKSGNFLVDGSSARNNRGSWRGSSVPSVCSSVSKTRIRSLNAESISLISIDNDEPEGCRGARRRKEIKRLAFGVRGLENSATLSH